MPGVSLDDLKHVKPKLPILLIKPKSDLKLIIKNEMETKVQIKLYK